MQRGIFFTFEGLNLILKEEHKNLPFPEGNEHFQEGFERENVPTIEEMVSMALELGIKFNRMSNDNGYYELRERCIC